MLANEKETDTHMLSFSYNTLKIEKARVKEQLKEYEEKFEKMFSMKPKNEEK
jgi:hypothetical protein